MQTIQYNVWPLKFNQESLKVTRSPLEGLLCFYLHNEQKSKCKKKNVLRSRLCGVPPPGSKVKQIIETIFHPRVEINAINPNQI